MTDTHTLQCRRPVGPTSRQQWLCKRAPRSQRSPHLRPFGDHDDVEVKVAALRRPTLHRATHPRRSTAARAGSAASIAAAATAAAGGARPCCAAQAAARSQCAMSHAPGGTRTIARVYLSDACTIGKPMSTVLSAALGRRDSGVDRMRQPAERPGPPWPVVEPRSAHDDAIGTLARSREGQGGTGTRVHERHREARLGPVPGPQFGLTAARRHALA